MESLEKSNQKPINNQAVPVSKKEETAARFQMMSQAVLLALVAVLVVYLFRFMGLSGIGRIGMVAVGLGSVIFIHELGHFAVAKWCDVHVETFSIGFGPAIPGCSFQRGETLYKIAWFPLGGYVKMVGEGTENEEDDDDPRSFKNKSVWQRMAIISAGVVMNVILGFLCFIFVYNTRGDRRPTGGIGTVDSGSPAYVEGVQSGTMIDRIGNRDKPYFDDLRYLVILSNWDESIPLTYHQPGNSPVSIHILPRLEKDDIHPVIGVAPPSELKLWPKSRNPPFKPVVMSSAAARAKPPFEFGDSIVGSTDAMNPDKVTPLPIDPRNDQVEQPDYFEFQKRLQILAGKPMVVQVRRQGESSDAALVDISVPPAYTFAFGLRMRMGQVTAVRKGSPAEQSGIQPRVLSAGKEGDIIKEVEVKDGETTIRFVTSLTNQAPKGVEERLLDPLRLPWELEHWAARQEEGKKDVLVRVLRPKDHEGRKEFPAIKLKWDDSWRFNHEVPVNSNSPQSIPGLGFAFQVQTVVDAVQATSPADRAGIQKDDVIKKIKFYEPGKEADQSTADKWVPLESDHWAHVFFVLQEADLKQVTLLVDRAGKEFEFTLEAVEDPTWPHMDRGFRFMPETRIQKAEGFLEAISLGLQKTQRSIVGIYAQIKAMITRRVSIKAIGGPIMIASVAYEFASQDVYAFIMFLGMISINLAVINFLPIPILDGGHMVFLIYEKIRGIPASESVRAVAAYVGLVLIVSLMAFTIYLDWSRHK